MRRVLFAAALAAVLSAASPAWAQLGKADLEKATAMVQRKIYLRIDAPCRYFMDNYGNSFVSVNQVMPLVEVSPTEVRPHSARPDFLGEDVVWYARPNDPMQHGKLTAQGGIIEVGVEGLPPNAREVVLRFVRIKTFQDFQAAFDRAFSLVPLQDEHADWPADIKSAIAARRVVAGMTPEQAFCVVGQPVSTDKSGNVETWYPRQAVSNNKNANRIEPTSFPKSLEFVDGKLTTIGEVVPREKLEPLLPKSEAIEAYKTELFAKTFYLRIDVPYRWALQKPYMAVEVSPDSVRIPDPFTADQTDYIFWSLRPNDKVTIGKVSQSGGTWTLEGSSKLRMRLVGVKTLDDFKKAFNRAFSEVPLQDEHQDWPAPVRAGIKSRCAVPGMTPEQLYMVTGVPMDVEKREENGAKLEVWFQRDKLKVCKDAATGTGEHDLAPNVHPTFVDGKLVLTGAGGK